MPATAGGSCLLASNKQELTTSGEGC